MGSEGVDSIECPHCGQHIRPAPRCSSCGVHLEKSHRFKQRHFIIGAAVFSVLLVIQLYGSLHKIPLIRIGRITPRKNFSTVRVEGVLETAARKLSDGSGFYRVNDGTGSLPVFADLKPGTKLPAAGSRVSVIGHLIIGAGNDIRMRASVGEPVVVLAAPQTHPLTPGFKLADIRAGNAGERITVSGCVSRVWTPEPGSKAPHRIVLEDPSGTLDVVHWLDQVPAVKVGDNVTITGTVNVYRGHVQLRLRSGDPVQPAEPGPASK